MKSIIPTPIHLAILEGNTMIFKNRRSKHRLCLAILAVSIFGTAHAKNAAREFIPTGMKITPTAALGSVFQTLNPDLPNRPQFVADHAVDMATSPDGKTLLVLTSGYNRNADAAGARIAAESNEYVFVYDISNGNPVKKQVLQVPNTFNGIAWNPKGTEFYVSGGVDDNIHVYSLSNSVWAESGAPIALGHIVNPADPKGINLGGAGLAIRPMAAGLSVNASGTYLLAANYENDSVSLINLATRKEVTEFDLRPGKIDPTQSSKAGGTYPFAVKFKGDNKAYISSQRDREILVVDINGEKVGLAKRIKTDGQPTKMAMNKAMSQLFVASDNDDSALVLDTTTDSIIETIPTIAPKQLFDNRKSLRGANPNNVALSADEKTLLVTNGGTNSVAVIQLGDNNKKSYRHKAHSRVVGLIPTGWYPSAVTTNGKMLYVINAKGNTGPNPDACRDTLSIAPGSSNTCNAANQYVWQMEKAGFLTMPLPTPEQLTQLTWQVAKNSNFPLNREDDDKNRMARFLRHKIKHVIYIVKENRTYDQVLGDLPIGNGDPSLAIMSPYSPNHVKLAMDFFTLDNFYDSGETSGVGWNWTTAARTNDSIEKTQPPNYASRGLSYDWEGDNRNVNVGLATVAERIAKRPETPNDPDMLAGTADIAAPDSSDGEEGAGYIWNTALRKGLTLRNYGFYVDNLGDSNKLTDDQLARPFANNVPQVVATKKALEPHTDVYFRGYDQNNADFYLYKEWEREFNQYTATGKLPNLSFVRLPHDHFGNFATAKFGVNTVETQMADNDYAVGLLIEKIANSPFKDNTLVFVVEDDAQNGGDHVDAHRSIAYIVGPYVKHGALISKPYTTVSLLHTMSEILGLEPMGLNDGLSDFMDVFDHHQKKWVYTAVVPKILSTTKLPLPAPALVAASLDNDSCQTPALHNASYWSGKMAGQNFTVEDKLDVEAFNRALWIGLKGEGIAYPSHRSGEDLRNNRAALLAKYQAALKPAACGSKVASR
jgi:DNA-binding beta-propeller fold protein YncE